LRLFSLLIGASLSGQKDSDAYFLQGIFMFLYAVQSEKALSISQEIILLAHLLKSFRFSENEKEINKNHLKHHFADFLL
jgi:hypothetical protein